MTKKSKTLVCLSGTTFVLAALFSSCGEKKNLTPNPNNPPVQILPEKAFTIKVFVEEQGIDKDSLYTYAGEVKSDCPDGKVSFTSVTGSAAKTFAVEPDIVELVLTPWNSIRFETTAPVNASSSTDVADIVKDGDLQNYRLKARIDTDNPRDLKTFDVVDATKERDGKVKAIAEGYTDIRFWNGAGTGAGNSITIRVRTANHIDVEGFELAIDGKRVFLVEGTKETTYSDLKEDAVLCRLPNIAKPSEEYYERGKTDYKTEEIFHIEKFSTIEFIGTIPRNATPDNRLTQKIDVLSFRNYGIGPKEDWSDAYYWSSDNYSEFRWMPYRKETQSDFGQPFPPSLGGKRAYKLYPADVRYRKSMIWNYFSKERSERYNENDFYFDYSVAPDPDNVKDVKYYWGKLFLELAKK